MLASGKRLRREVGPLCLQRDASSTYSASSKHRVARSNEHAIMTSVLLCSAT